MAETTTIQKIYDEIKGIKKDVIFIKRHMFDPDTIMTAEESRRFEESLKELKEGKFASLSELKKEIGL